MGFNMIKKQVLFVEKMYGLIMAPFGEQEE